MRLIDILKSVKLSGGNTVKTRYSISDRCGSTLPRATQKTGTARISAKKRIRIRFARFILFIRGSLKIARK